jgi:hypothetical protein
MRQAGWEIAVRKVLKKDEHIVLAIFAFWGTLVFGIKSLKGGDKKKE